MLIFALAPFTGLIKVFMDFKEAPLLLDFLFITLIVYIILSKSLKYNNVSIKIPFIGLLIIGFFLLAFAEIFNPFMPSLERGIYGFRSSGAFYMISFFVSSLIINSKEDILKISKTFIITGFFVAIYGIYQFLNPSQQEIEYIMQGTEWFGWSGFAKPFSTMIGPTHFGMFMVLSGLTILTFLLTKKNELKINRNFLKIAFIFILIALLISLSRGSILALVIGTFFILITFKGKKMKFIYLFIFSIILLIFLFAIIPQFEIVEDRVYSLTNKSDPALHTRFTIWPERINDIIKNPLGYGIGVTGGGDPIPFKWCDNQFISIGVETGFTGLFIFLWIIWLILRKENNLIKSLEDPSHKIIVIWITAFTVSMLWNMLTNQTLLLYPVSMYFWFMIGILYRLKFIEQKNMK